MYKETLLQTYIDIETKTYIRSDKNKKLNNFIAAILTSENSLNLVDMLSTVDALFATGTTIRHPFFKNVIYPVLSNGIEENNLEAIKQLIKLFKYNGNFEYLIQDKKHTRWTLLTKGLQLSPDDEELLIFYESWREDYFDYTLHELPSGVLYDSDGATIEQCDELLNDLAEYEEVCRKLKLDRQKLISDCKLYYNLYKNYLTVCKSYTGFADYLNKQNITGN